MIHVVWNVSAAYSRAVMCRILNPALSVVRDALRNIPTSGINPVFHVYQPRCWGGVLFGQGFLYIRCGLVRLLRGPAILRQGGVPLVCGWLPLRRGSAPIHWGLCAVDDRCPTLPAGFCTASPLYFVPPYIDGASFIILLTATAGWYAPAGAGLRR